MNKKREIESSVKDESLIVKRREQMIRGAVTLFKEKGFHRTTTREIAKAAGFSIGTLYEYIRTKEDVLFLVCDNIFNEVTKCLTDFPSDTGTIGGLKQAIRQYYLLIDQMPEEFTIMYQETKSLPKAAMHYILDKELEMVAIFERILKDCVAAGNLSLSEDTIYLAANHIVVQGQRWAFRKWALQKRYTIDQYINLQTTMFLQGIMQFEN